MKNVLLYLVIILIILAFVIFIFNPALWYISFILSAIATIISITQKQTE